MDAIVKVYDLSTIIASNGEITIYAPTLDEDSTALGLMLGSTAVVGQKLVVVWVPVLEEDDEE